MDQKLAGGAAEVVFAVEMEGSTCLAGWMTGCWWPMHHQCRFCCTSRAVRHQRQFHVPGILFATLAIKNLMKRKILPNGQTTIEPMAKDNRPSA
jgi:hypothetical protein